MSDGAPLDLRTAVRTTGTVRRFRDTPVGDDVLYRVLDDARFAPSGNNHQPWRVAVVRDHQVRRQMADEMRVVWNDYVAARVAGVQPFVDGAETGLEPLVAPNDLLDRIDEVPVVLVVAADRQRIAMMDGRLERPALTGGASVYPFCWNLLLAARAHGLGGVLTTFLSRREPQIADTVGLPEHHALAATIFLGYPEHQPTRLTRRRVETFATVDRFDGLSFGAGAADGA
ncbi:MAG: nitroreductase family protein [Ilumatobacteraceae bacterium]